MLILAVTVFGGTDSYADEGPSPQAHHFSGRSVFEMSLDELLAMKITSVSKKPEKLVESPAAVYVITREDIRRSGVTNIPDALRLAPGVEVAQINSHKWAISIRGFQQELAGKLLVLIDGRSIYSPLFSGVFWDSQDVMLEDVDRIEVIRGPGAALWGANAVNGIINIITRSAEDTQGGLAFAGAGNQEKRFGGIRYGNRVKNNYWRLYAKAFKRGPTTRSDYETANGFEDMNDDWESFRTGLRMDSRASGRDRITLEGDYFYNKIHDIADDIPSLTPPYLTVQQQENPVKGGNVLGRWTRRYSESSSIQLQAFYDRLDREDINANFRRETTDFDFQHSFKVGRHGVVWGAGYRFIHDHFDTAPAVTFDPPDESVAVYSTFLQDEIALIEKTLSLTLGSKFEHNDYTGFEIQPSIRLLWIPASGNQAWAAVSRAVRTPNRVDRDILANVDALPPDTLYAGQPAGFIQLTGQNDVKSEDMVAYEIGYRLQPTTDLYFDLAAYYDVYRNLIFLDSREGLGDPFVNADGAVILPVYIENTGKGSVYGGEFVAEWHATDWWRWTGSYTLVKMNLRGDPRAGQIEGETPENQFQIHSFLNLPYHIQLDGALFYVGKITGFSEVNIHPSYRADIRIGWMPIPGLDLSFTCLDVFDDHTTEHGEKAFGTYSEVGRSYYGKATYGF